MSEDSELVRVLGALRQQYVGEASGRIADLLSALDRLAGGDSSALGELRQLLHRLAGSGGAYGLQAVTDTARAGEQAIHGLQQRQSPVTTADLRQLREHITSVASAFREAGADL